MSKSILDDTYDFLGRFVAYPSKETRVAHTLWIVHTHLMEEWENTPRIAFLSPEPASGKTRALEITALLVPRPLKTASISTAALFRSVEKFKPTVLLDETDTVFGDKAKDNEDLRGLLNDGYGRGAVVLRCDGSNNEVKEFPAYCAVGMAGLGNLPDTILTRAVIVRMRKRKTTEKVEDYRSRIHAPEGHALRDRIAVWAETQKGKLRDIFPTMPEGVADRDADVWEPLIVIADAAGGDWPEKARGTAGTLVTLSRRDGRGSLGVRLLSDLRIVFEGVDRLHTTTILEGLSNLPEAPWRSIKGEPITDRLLSSLLSRYEVKSKNIRIEKDQKKGYERADLLDAWERHLEPLRVPKESVPYVPSVPVESSSIEFDFSVPSPQMSAANATGATAANDNPKPSFDEWRDMSRVEQDALHARLRKQPSF